jgi:HipA-like protein
MANLPVYFEQRLVGTIHVDRSGPSFTYASGWIGLKGAFPISLTMPLKPERFASDTFLPWAANLLPESEQLRTLGQLLGMARSDVIGLLSAIGGDTAGALSFSQAGRASSVQWRPVGKSEELERLIEDLPNKPFLVGEEGVSMSLAGVQSKIAVAIDDDGRICIPMNGSPSNAHSQAGLAASARGSSERSVLFDVGKTYEDSDAGSHNRPGRQAHLSTCEAIRPNRCRRPLSSLAPGGLLPGARQAAIR